MFSKMRARSLIALSSSTMRTFAPQIDVVISTADLEYHVLQAVLKLEPQANHAATLIPISGVGQGLAPAQLNANVFS